jgi:hypothetical protein
VPTQAVPSSHEARAGLADYWMVNLALLTGRVRVSDLLP